MIGLLIVFDDDIGDDVGVGDGVGAGADDGLVMVSMMVMCRYCFLRAVRTVDSRFP